MFSATRCPASACRAGRFCACSPRTRSACPDGESTSRSSDRDAPRHQRAGHHQAGAGRVNTRSTASRG